MDEPDYKQPEITFKYYAQDNKEDIWLHMNAREMWSVLWDVDQRCRCLIRHGHGQDLSLDDFAQEIRDMISQIDLNKVS